MRIYYAPKASAGPRVAAFLIAVASAIALLFLATMLALEVLNMHGLRALLELAPPAVFSLMLVSLASVVVSVALPESAGKAALWFGAAGFFVCLAAALVFGVKF